MKLSPSFLRRRIRAAHGRQARGFALIEALVALLIFSFGVLGLVALQAAMSQAQVSAKSRADAAYLASEIVGTMWTDLANLSSYDTGTGCAAGTRCNEWKGKVATVLPGGTPSVTVSATGDVAIRISWSLPNGETHVYATQTTVRGAS